MENITNFIRIESNPKRKMSLDGDFFRSWAEFLTPVHRLTKRERDVLAAFLKERWELGNAIVDQEILDRVLMSEEVKKKIRIKCNLSSKHFQVIMTAFRKKGVLKDNKLASILIPFIDSPEGVGLMIYFDFKDEQLVKLSNTENKQELMS